MMLRHPALLGQEAATLDEISGGRLRLGIGVSHKVTIEDWYGMTLDDPVGRISEYTRILRQIFTAGGGTFEGKHYTSRFSFIGYEARKDLKILWAAMGPRMVRAATELADGIVLWMCSPSHIRDTIRPAVDEGLEAAGRSGDDFEVVAAVPLALTANPEAAREAFRQQAFPYLNLPFYRKEIARAHPDVLGAFDERMGAGDMAGALEALGPGFVDDYAGIGGADALRAKIEDYRSAGVTLPAVGPLPRRDGSAGVEATLEAAIAG
jgi:alkanesulfonate monooxygenase SsuD/methylene tetrahydromethanopterin reductase-like flavin-dependent oxidoreductase (luciferase family)